MSKKWVGKKKTINFSQQELEALEKVVEITGRTETDLIREGLRYVTQMHLKSQQA